MIDLSVKKPVWIDLSKINVYPDSDPRVGVSFHPSKLVSSGCYRGISFWIVERRRNSTYYPKWWCAYVQLPGDSAPYDEVPFPCHGGLTFGPSDHIYGWDFEHACDEGTTYQEVYDDVIQSINSWIDDKYWEKGAREQPSGVCATSENANTLTPCKDFVPTLAAYEWCPGEIPETCKYCSLQGNCPKDSKQ